MDSQEILFMRFHDHVFNEHLDVEENSPWLVPESEDYCRICGISKKRGKKDGD